MRNVFRFGLAAGAMCASVFGPTNLASAQETDGSTLLEKVAGQQLRLVVVNNEDSQDDSKDEASAEDQDEAPKFWLGISLKSVDGDLATYLGSAEGILVDSVYPKSPAEIAGLLKGDILLAAGDEKLSEPTDLLEQMKAVKIGDDGKAAPLKISVLRKGEKIKVDLIPTERPSETVVTVEGSGGVTEDVSGESSVLLLDLHGKSPEELENMVKGGLRVFRFGQPAGWIQGEGAANTQMHINRSEDGKNLEISITREGDAPAKIVVKQDGEAKEYTSDKLDEMPEDVRKMTKEMLEKKGQVIIETRVDSSANENGDKDSSKNQQAKKSQRPSRIAIMRPEGQIEMHIGELLKGEAMNKELAQKYQEMAEQIANRARESADWAKDAAAFPAEVKELQSQVQALRAEVKELRSQLKAKETADK